jgi:hypothetical protein
MSVLASDRPEAAIARPTQGSSVGSLTGNTDDGAFTRGNNVLNIVTLDFHYNHLLRVLVCYYMTLW